MLVYRVENNKGLGPYRNIKTKKHSLHKMCDEHSESSYHLPWMDDFTRTTYEELRTGIHISGFKSMDDLFKWFGPWMGILIYKRFRICVYKVNEADVFYSKSGRQIIFNKSKALNLVYSY